MAEISVTELKAAASAVVGNVEGGASYVVTKRGRAVAVFLPLEQAEEMVLASADEFNRLRRQARAAHAKGRSRSLGHMDRGVSEATNRRRS